MNPYDMINSFVDAQTVFSRGADLFWKSIFLFWELFFSMVSIGGGDVSGGGGLSLQRSRPLKKNSWRGVAAPSPPDAFAEHAAQFAFGS